MDKESAKNIYQKINEVMRQVSYIQKDKTVSITTKKGGTYTYAAVTHDAVTSALRDAMIECGIVPVVSVTGHEQHNERTMLNLTMALVNAENPAEVVQMATIAYGDDYGDKGPGKAMSYGVKNLYLKLFMIPTGESDENRLQPISKQIDASQYKALEALMKSTDTNEEQFIGFLNGQTGLSMMSIAEIPRERYALAETMLLKKKRQSAKKEKADE